MDMIVISNKTMEKYEVNFVKARVYFNILNNFIFYRSDFNCLNYIDIRGKDSVRTTT